MRKSLFWSIVAATLTVSAAPSSEASELLGGSYSRTKWIGDVPYTTHYETWSYQRPPATAPDNFRRPPTRGPGTQQDTGYSKSNEDRKKAIRDASGYRDPPGTRELR